MVGNVVGDGGDSGGDREGWWGMWCVMVEIAGVIGRDGVECGG